MLVGWVIVVATQPHATREELWLKISSCVCHFSVLAHSPLQGNIAIGYSWESENTFCCKQQTTQATKVQKNTPICILTEEGKITGRPANSNTHTHQCTHAHTHISRTEEIIKHLEVNSVERSAVLLKGDFEEMGMENEDCLCGPI